MLCASVELQDHIVLQDLTDVSTTMTLPNAAEYPPLWPGTLNAMNVSIDSYSTADHSHDFLAKRRSKAAGRFADFDEMDMGAIYKRRMQVANARDRATEQITQLGLKSSVQKHHGKGLWASLHLGFLKGKKNGVWRLYGEQLKAIEGKFGSAVMVVFAFLRWVFLLNVFLTILWLSAIIIPFLRNPPATYRWSGFKQFFQGNGLDKTWVYYGGYSYTFKEQNGWYKTDYMYPCTIAATFLLSLLALLGKCNFRFATKHSLPLSLSTACGGDIPLDSFRSKRFSRDISTGSGCGEPLYSHGC